jgi:hypothetical protein
VPGETSWAEAQNVLATFASQIGRTGSPDRALYSVYIPVPEELYPSTRLIYEYSVHNGIIQMIQAMFPLDHYEAYTLPSILSTYGQPEEVWVRTFDRPRERTLPFYVALFYPQQGFMIRYRDNAERACFHPEQHRPLLWSWSPERNRTFMETAAEAVDFGLDEEKEYLPLEEATGMTVETIYQIFQSAQNDICLQTPAVLWPPPV